jgi:hypothetical protein
MSPLISQLETTLRLLLQEQHALLRRLNEQQQALSTHDAARIERATAQLDAARLRVAQIEVRRRSLTLQAARASKLGADITLQQLAGLHPQRKLILLQLREELRGVISQINDRTRMLARITGGVLGHLNVTTRIITQAVNGPGIYGKPGRSSAGIKSGLLNAVG